MINKVLILIVGVLLGIIIGGGIFWHFSNPVRKNIFIVNQQTGQQQEGSNRKFSDLLNKKDNKNNPEKSIEPEGIKEVAVKMDSLGMENIEHKEFDPEMRKHLENQMDTTLLALVTDSVFSIFNQTPYEEPIVVKKDELVLTKKISLIDLDLRPDGQVPRKDSLLQATSGIIEPAGDTYYIIEFWKSPINYRGYKMGRSKIVLFGLQVSENAKLFKINNNLFLKNTDKVYRIEKSADFRAFETVSDQDILNRINQ